jgi:hypothetical protein
MSSKARWTFGATAIRRHVLTWAAVLCLAAMGCGGGGGGGGTAASQSLTYSGLETPAEITAANAGTLAVDALNAGASSSTISGIAALETSGQVASSLGRPVLADVAKSVESAVGQIDLQTAAQPNATAALKSGSYTVDGTCGGRAVYNIQADTVTGQFSGSLSFQAYCESGMTIDGSASFWGTADVSVNPPVIESFTLDFDYLTGTAATGSLTMDGQIAYAISGSSMVATMDMMVQDNSTGRVCKVEDYRLDFTDYGSYVEFEVNGRFFDPDYGYVDLVTNQRFRVYSDDEYPTSGQAVITGEGGTSGPQQARLTAIDDTNCRVEADLDGDGTFEYDSDTIPWTDL